MFSGTLEIFHLKPVEHSFEPPHVIILMWEIIILIPLQVETVHFLTLAVQETLEKIGASHSGCWCGCDVFSIKAKHLNDPGTPQVIHHARVISCVHNFTCFLYPRVLYPCVWRPLMMIDWAPSNSCCSELTLPSPRGCFVYDQLRLLVFSSDVLALWRHFPGESSPSHVVLFIPALFVKPLTPPPFPSASMLIEITWQSFLFFRDSFFYKLLLIKIYLISLQLFVTDLYCSTKLWKMNFCNFLREELYILNKIYSQNLMIKNPSVFVSNNSPLSDSVAD